MHYRWFPARFPAGALLLVMALGGCATVPNGASDDAQRDPLEPFNRGVFAVNQSLDRAVIKPVAKAYRSALPETVRDRIRAFVDNLGEPLTFANDLLQGRGEAAGATGRRFIINSTIGFAGLFDRASEFGEVRQSGDFGQTLFAWGVTDGPYLMLPFFGPSTVRDAFGFGVDTFASPMGRIGSDATRTKVGVTVGIVGGVDLRSRNIETLDAIEEGSLDYYVYLRSVWRQHREATLREARDSAPPPDLDLTDPGAPATPAVK